MIKKQISFIALSLIATQCIFPMEKFLTTYKSIPNGTTVCGICEKADGDKSIHWPNHASISADTNCFTTVGSSYYSRFESCVQSTNSIQTTPDKLHKKLIKLVRAQCAMPLLQYQLKHGSPALERIFDAELQKMKNQMIIA